MRRTDALIVLAVAAVMLSAPAAGFGYMAGDTDETVAPGGTATFTVYIAADDPVAASASGPDGWTVDVDPEQVDADTAAGARYVRTGDGYTRVVPVETTVTASDTAQSGAYTVTAAFEQHGPGDGNGARLAVTQTQDVPFTVTVEEGYTPPSSSSSSGTAGGSGGGGGSGGSGGGGGGGGFFQQARDILGGGGGEQDDTGADTGDTGKQGDGEQDTDRQLIPAGNETGTDEQEDDGSAGDTGATGLLTGVPSSLVLAFELLWVVVVAYLLLRRR